MAPNDGPTLSTYVETRLNLLTESLKEQALAQKEALAALKSLLEASQLASDLRYQQRFDAQSDALSAAFASQQTAMSTALVTAEKAVLVAQAAADRAVSKAELAADKRFEGVNEFRETLADQQRTLMPRAEQEVINKAQDASIAKIESIIGNRVAEALGAKGGWALAIGVVVLISILIGMWMKLGGRP